VRTIFGSWISNGQIETRHARMKKVLRRIVVLAFSHRKAGPYAAILLPITSNIAAAKINDGPLPQ
jgi:hypothetical protein